MPRTSERGGPQTRARILEISTRLFIERGYDAVTVADVAREAGVSSVTVFKHFARKEDLFLDRADDAVELLRAAVRERDTDVLTSLEATAQRLFHDRHPLSGVDSRSVPFFRTVAGSPALIARAREIAADLQRVLTEELQQDETFTGDATLLAAFFIAGYAGLLVGTAGRLITGDSPAIVVPDHHTRLRRLFQALRTGVPQDVPQD
jgi:AcrR family transcriptional regulator